MPDPAVMVAELFGERIRERARDGEVAQVLREFPQGYLAVQFSADFGDDDSLAQITTQLDRVLRPAGFGHRALPCRCRALARRPGRVAARGGSV